MHRTRIMANDYDSNSGRWRTLKAWCWIIGLLAVAVLAVILFVKIVWWLVWIGAAAVVAFIVWLCYAVWKSRRQVRVRKSDA